MDAIIPVITLAVALGLIPAVVAQRRGFSHPGEFMVWWLFGSILLIVALPAAFIAKPGQPDGEPERATRPSGTPSA